jgi:hypothetical protein
MLHFLGNKSNVMYIMCSIGVKMGICKRWHHHYMGLQRSLQRNKMPPMQKNAFVGCPIIVFCLQQVGNYKFPLTNGQATCHNFEIWSIFGGHANKCHMGWWLGLLTIHFYTIINYTCVKCTTFRFFPFSIATNTTYP